MEAAGTVRLLTERVVDGVWVCAYETYSAEDFEKMCAEEAEKE